MRILGIPVKISPLLPVLLLIGMVLGLGAELGIALSSLILHEFCHALAARLLRVRVMELELMPMGGAARMEDLWSLRPQQVALISLAGPAANALLIAMASTLAFSEVIGPWTAMLWIEANLSLMLFNLMPVLPLDGGRVLCALLGAVMGERRAVRLFARLGQGLGAVMIAGALAMFFWRGTLNVTLVFAGAFLITSAGREMNLSGGGAVLSLLKRREEIADEGALPVRWVAALDSQTAAELLPLLQARALHRVAVYSDALGLMGVVEERELLSAPGGTALGEMVGRSR